jgi:hypothetical protein
MIRVNQNLQGKKKRKEPHITLLMQTCPKHRNKQEKDSNFRETDAQIKTSKIAQRRKRIYGTDRHVFEGTEPKYNPETNGKEKKLKPEKKRRYILGYSRKEGGEEST